jgi:hypothetical protein
MEASLGCPHIIQDDTIYRWPHVAAGKDTFSRLFFLFFPIVGACNFSSIWDFNAEVLSLFSFCVQIFLINYPSTLQESEPITKSS